MKPETKHTPAPWRAVSARTLVHFHGPNGYFGISLPGKTLEDQANSSFIIRAVNLHEILYIRLKVMAWSFHENGKHGGLFSKCGMAVCEANRDALSACIVE